MSTATHPTSAQPPPPPRKQAAAATVLGRVFGEEVLAALHEGVLKGDLTGVVPLLAAATASPHLVLRWCFAPPHPVDCQWFSPGWNTELKFGVPSWSFTFQAPRDRLSRLSTPPLRPPRRLPQRPASNQQAARAFQDGAGHLQPARLLSRASCSPSLLCPALGFHSSQSNTYASAASTASIVPWCSPWRHRLRRSLVLVPPPAMLPVA